MILQQSSSSPSYSECFLPFLEAGGEVTGEMISAGTGEYFFLAECYLWYSWKTLRKTRAKNNRKPKLNSFEGWYFFE